MHSIFTRTNRVFLLITLLAICYTGSAQAPNLLNYQGVARNSVGNPLPNQTMTLRVSIRNNSFAGPVLYTETRTIQTNLGGLFAVQVGSAGAISSVGTILGVNWQLGSKFLQVEIDPKADNRFLDLGTVQLVSVPYAFTAGTAATVSTNANLTGAVTSIGNETSLAASPVLTGVPIAPTAAPGTNTTQIATTAFVTAAALTGPTGATGPQGIQGLPGAAGAVGAIGPQGIPGLVGAQGPAGAQGIPGPIGATGSVANVGAISSSSTTNGASITAGVLNLAPASAAYGGIVTNGAQTFAGPKTFSENVITNGTLKAGTITYPNTAGTNGYVLTTDGSGIASWAAGAGVPYTGATGAVNLGAFDLAVNGLKVGKGAGTNSQNTALGNASLGLNITGTVNSAVGFESLKSNTTGAANTAFGAYALRENRTGAGNTAVGNSSLQLTNGAYDNTAVGNLSAVANTSGSYNTAVGSNSLLSNTAGSDNTSVGYEALYLNQANGNTASGYQSMRQNIGGGRNTALGYTALYSNTTASYNVAVGAQALGGATSGERNVAIGAGALDANVTGSYNTVLGGFAGRYFAGGLTTMDFSEPANGPHMNTKMDNSILIGAWAKPNANNETNEIVIGFNAIGNGSNTIQLGNTAVLNVKTSGTITAGNITYPNTNGTNGQVLTANSNGAASWTTVSGGSGSQWATSGGDINFNTGNVGIGTTTPSAKLQVVGGDRNNMLRVESDNNASLSLKNTNANAGGGEYQMFVTSSNSNPAIAAGSLGIYFDHPSAAGYRFSINKEGNVGIGTGMPTTKLDVTGAIKSSGTITAGTVTYPNTAGTPNQVLTTDGSGVASWATASSAAAAGTLTGNTLNSTVTSSGLTSLGTIASLTSVSITNSGKVIVGASSAASSSAVLEASSTTQGFLPPRMTAAQKIAISNPATGLIIYCTNCGVNGEPEYYNGTSWLNMAGSAAAAGPVVVGTQQWMEKNLDVSTYRNGDIIPQVTDPTAWAGLTTGAWCYYDNDPLNGAIYGKLYNWYAVNDSRGLAPQGWHIPTDAEWSTLSAFLGGDAQAGGKMYNSNIWGGYNPGATNQSGYTAVPGGDRYLAGQFGNAGGESRIWTVTETNFSNSYNVWLQGWSNRLNRQDMDKRNGFSVRCLRD